MVRNTNDALPSPNWRGWCAALAALTVVVIPTLASGQASVAIVAIEIEGELDLELLDQVSAAVEAGIGPAAEAVIAHDIVAETMRQAGMSTDCVDEPCLAELGLLTEAEVLLRVRVTGSSQLYEMVAELLLARGGTVLGRSTGSCTVCTWDEALEGVTATVTELRAAMPGRVFFEVTPAAATVTVDGEPVEPAVGVLLPAGVRRIAVALEGYDPISREVTVPAGAELELPFTLVLDTPSEPSAARSLALWGWIVGGVGLATLVPGALWLGIDGNCAIGSETVDGICAELWDTRTEGWALTIVAGALIATGITLIAVHYARRRALRARARQRLIGAVPVGTRTFRTLY